MDKALRHRVNAARVAVKNQLSFFARQFGQVPSEWKEDETRVTFADFAISERILAELRNIFPGDDFCSEESNPLDDSMPLEARYAWVLDPIDGTNNYALGIPFCGISLALLKRGEPVYGLIHDFARGRLIEGGPGHGLFDGGRRVPPLPPDRPFDPKTGVVGMHFPLPEERCAQLRPLLTAYRVRSLGSGALNFAYAALGLLDGCADYKVKVWDIAAAYALARAAGLEFHPLGRTVFPLKTFHQRAPSTPYIAGSAAFCAAMRRWGAIR